MDQSDAIDEAYEEVESLEQLDHEQVIVATPVIASPVAPKVRKQGGKLVVVAAPKLTNPFKKPSRWIAQQLESAENKAAILAEMREIRERKMLEAALTKKQGFQLMR
jgi:predicted phosphoribosyltransferase